MWAAEAKAKTDIPIEGTIIPAGSTITIAKSGEEQYFLMGAGTGWIWSLPQEYIGQIVRIISPD